MSKIGFLPLYLELYDRCSQKAAGNARIFAKQAEERLRAMGLELEVAPVCRLKPEFDAAVAQFEAAGCEAILTLHLAYSPSLECIEALAKSELPIVIMDTTPDAEFTDPGTQIMPNHGIHGVQDMGNQLLRRNKPFLITAGAFEEPFLKRTVQLLKAAVMAYKMQHLRIGRVGGDFKGMGDFLFNPGTVGLTEIPWSNQPEPTEDEIRAEMDLDCAQFQFADVDEAQHHQLTRDSLRLRRWVEAEKLDGFTLCFMGFDRSTGADCVPFLECSKAMALGYAGEGDALTAGLHAALFRGFPDCGFSEMFCPDWKGNRIFTSHMGEINLALTLEKPVLKIRPFSYTDVSFQGAAYGCFKPGNAIWVDLAPMANGEFRLIAGEVVFLPQPENGKGADYNAGWFRPKNCTVPQFLERYTQAGGTHHAVVVYDGDVDTIANFAKLMKWDSLSI